ncbi:MAG: hypothetical protein R3E60_00655 [Alphaproteobacteria bacterium]
MISRGQVAYLFFSLSLATSAVTGCTYQYASTAPDLIAERGLPPPSRTKFTVCFNYGCSSTQEIKLSDAEWAEVTSFVQTPASTAKAEREHLAAAVAKLEKIVEGYTKTQDIGGTLKNVSKSGQLDCIDEATNTTTYLVVLEQQGFMHFHKTQATAWRGAIIVSSWPHTTAVVREMATNADYVIDSWFRDSGVMPDIVALTDWKAGWKPEGFSDP